jgi:uncharacterized protein (UPF0216 family)
MDKLTYQDAAKILNMTVAALRNKVSSQGIQLAKDGNRAYFTREQIEALKPDQGNDNVKIFLELSTAQAEALAQVLKRIRLDIIRGIAASDDEAYQALDALEIIIRELAEIGFNPR